jgi:hypothetical protein
MTQTQALTHALFLALIAPTDSRAQKAAELAEQLARGLGIDIVEQCKVAALNACVTN